MTNKEKMQAMLDGKVLECVDADGDRWTGWYDEEKDDFVEKMDGVEESSPFIILKGWQLPHEPRPMTREEVLGFVTNTPGVVIRVTGGELVPAQAVEFIYPVANYQWATIDKDGNIGEPREFVK